MYVGLASEPSTDFNVHFGRGENAAQQCDICIVWVVGIYWAFDETVARRGFGVDEIPRDQHLRLMETLLSFLHDSVREEPIAGSPSSGVEDTPVYDELMKRAQVVCCPFTAPVLVTIMPSFSGFVGS